MEWRQLLRRAPFPLLSWACSLGLVNSMATPAWTMPPADGAGRSLTAAFWLRPRWDRFIYARGGGMAFPRRFV